MGILDSLIILMSLISSSFGQINISLPKILSSQLLRQHNFSYEAYLHLSEEHFQTSLQSDDLKFICGKVDQIGSHDLSDSHFVYSNSKEGVFCSITNRRAEELSSNVQVLHLPHYLKIQHNVFSYIENSSAFANESLRFLFVVQFLPSKLSLRNISHEVLDLAHISKPKHFKELFHPNHVSRWSKLIHETIQVTGIFQEMSVENQAWVEVHERLSKHCPVYSKLRLLLSSTDVDISDFTEDIRIELYGNSLHIFGLFNPLFSPACLSILAHSASLCPFVLSVDIGEDFSFVNADGTASVQDDRIEKRPYHDAGLDGAGQICGVADSGVNDLSCFFADDSGVYETSSTSRSWGVESRRRKIIQYVPYADSVDDEGGHGTHTCGTLAGSSISFFQEEKGVAYRAKIAFFDIGIAVCPSHFLTFPLGFSMSTLPIVIPRLHAVLFPTAYTAGARVHSNSWAGGLSSYAVYSQEIDKYLHENPDFAIILAAGNRGQFGLGSVGSPANSKNAICVGSIQLRSTFDDSLAASGPVVSMTSSLGPTLDGRFKPDILALGEGVMSAYSSSVEDQYQAQHMKYTLWSRQGLDKFWNSLTSCSVHEKSGTSMATPLIAGSALLIRQYFMDQMFWASICGKMKVNKDQIWCKSFEPTGYLLKALILHGGKAVSSRLQPDLSTLSSLQSPPDSFQGYGAFGLHHILPLQNGLGLDPMLDLVVFDRLEIQELSLLRFNLTFPSCNATLPLKITLSWFDPPSLIGWMSHLLIHDIDIALISPSEDHVYWGNNASYGDHTNPNEQIYVFHPKCSFDFCTFSLLLRAHSFPFKKFEGPENTSMQAAQAIALVITTNALVLGPYAELMDDWPLPIVAQEPLPAVAVESFGHKHAVSHLTEPFHSSHDFSVSVDFFSVPLEVSPRGGEFSHNVVTIARFENKIESSLDAITLQLSPLSIPPVPLRPVPLLGLDAFLLTVTVVDSDGLAVEIGGFEWPTRTDNFYLRLWPSVWTLQNIPFTGGWIATRDVSAAGLGRGSLSSAKYRTDTLPDSLMVQSPRDWTVSLSVGFKFGARPVTFYSGSVTLWYSSVGHSSLLAPRSDNYCNTSSSLRFKFFGENLEHVEVSPPLSQTTHDIKFPYMTVVGLSASILLILALLIYLIPLRVASCHLSSRRLSHELKPLLSHPVRGYVDEVTPSITDDKNNRGS